MAVSEPGARDKGPPKIGSYLLLQPLGAGGMSSVFHAVHAQTGHEVALKVLPRSLAKNPTLLQRFLREARSAESLEHPSIAAIYDRGFDQGRHYLVLEYVEGGDLNDRVRNRGPLGLVDAVRVIRAVAEGLVYASGRGLIHRDVKPANLLLTPQGRVKIIDLGLALQTEAEDERVTRDGTTVGTVDYMAPEQARDSRATSERSDIYSLGCTFYYLLTGSPPYPGGDVPDKLGRHCTAKIPDVRELRPECSEPLALLIQRMMAKKPEGRFADHAHLIAAIDDLPELVGSSPNQPLDALVVDEDEDEDDGLPVDPAPVPVNRGRSSNPPPRAGSPGPRAEVAPIEVSLAALAALDADDEAPDRRSTRPSRGAPHPPGGFSTAMPTVEAGHRSSAPDLPLSTWIAAGAVLGLAIALMGVGVIQALTPAADPSASSGAIEEGQGGEANDLLPVIAPRGRAADRDRPPSKAVANRDPEHVPEVVAWSEPGDPPSAPPPEAVYPPEVEAVSLPDWARRPVRSTAEGPTVTLRRVPLATDPADVASLRQALDKPGGVVEVADNGPFFEDDCRVAGKDRLIRARLGFRPMLKVEPSSLALVRDRPAVFVLDGTKLILDGIDVVVDAGELSPVQTTLFLLRGSELTLKSCTVTILNAAGRSFSLARVEEPQDHRAVRSSQVRLEQTMIRCPSPTVIDLAGPGDLAINRSLLLGGAEAVVSVRAAAGRGDRRLYLARSVVATRGSLLMLPVGRAPVPLVRAVGSTFARTGGTDSSPLVAVKDTNPVGVGGSFLDWWGSENAYLGWPSWLGPADRPAPILLGLAAVQEAWPKSDASSRETRRGWPTSALDPTAPDGAIRELPEARPSTLGRVASPSPSILAQTVGSIDPQPTPELPGRAGIRAASLGGQPSLRPTNLMNSRARADEPTLGPAAGRQAVGRETVPPGEAIPFDLADPAWGGDLGLFLGRVVRAGSPRVRIRVIGGGSRPMTPVRLPDGASVEIEASAPAGAGPQWVAKPGSSGAALLEVEGGDLSLNGLSFSRAGSAGVPWIVKVVDGHLLIARSTLRSEESAASSGSGLILFRAPGTRPLALRSHPFASPTDRPICRVVDSVLTVVGGEAIAAELGRGIVSLDNTAVLSESDGAAIALRPQKVARSRFEADLTLDRCTIAAEQSLVRLGPWPGTDPGPARPWLVESSRSAFFGVAPRGSRGAVLLRSSEEGLAHGALFWQSSRDGYDLAHFTAADEQKPAPGLPRPDVKSQWIDFWGARHIERATGPSPRSTEPSLTLASRGRLRPGGLTAEAVRLDPRAHPDLGIDLRVLPSDGTRATPPPQRF